VIDRRFIEKLERFVESFAGQDPLLLVVASHNPNLQNPEARLPHSEALTAAVSPRAHQRN